MIVGCGGGGQDGGPVCADGSIQTSWAFTPGSSGCVPGDRVGVRVDDNTMVAYVPCTAGAYMTPAVLGGVQHTLDLTLFDASGNVVEQSPPIDVVVPCGTVATTPTYDFTD
jgi:hypothetical protein